MIFYKDEKYNFFEIFNEKNGWLFRSDINGMDPPMRSFPELLDVGIMGHCVSSDYCTKAGIDCYQNGHSIDSPHMKYEDFLSIVKQSSGKVFQIALGGAGDPNKHPQFAEILKTCRDFGIVPNLTTSGFNLSIDEIDLIKKYCGAVAVSWYSRLRKGKESNPKTILALETLIKANCTVNIHYVVSNDTIGEAIYRMENNLFPRGINAVIFLLYKPVGLGVEEKTIKLNNKHLKTFLSLATEREHPFRIGFDTCFTPAIMSFSNYVEPICIDNCEAATFSMYIDSQMNCYPCSFGIWDNSFSESLNDKKLQEIWLGKAFTSFRRRKKEKCLNCEKYSYCKGGCKLDISIDLC